LAALPDAAQLFSLELYIYSAGVPKVYMKDVLRLTLYPVSRHEQNIEGRFLIRCDSYPRSSLSR